MTNFIFPPKYFFLWKKFILLFNCSLVLFFIWCPANKKWYWCGLIFCLWFFDLLISGFFFFNILFETVPVITRYESCYRYIQSSDVPKTIKLGSIFFFDKNKIFVVVYVADKYILINILRIIILKNDKDFAVLHQDNKQHFFKVDKLGSTSMIQNLILNFQTFI